eukprot:457356-Prymnesium_polylepis.1
MKKSPKPKSRRHSLRSSYMPASALVIEPSGPLMASAGARIVVKAQMKAHRTCRPTASVPL